MLALLGLGIAIRQLGLLPDGAPRVLEMLVVRLALPALVLSVSGELAISAELLIPVAAAWGIAMTLAVVTFLAARLAGLDRAVTGTLLLVVPLGNTSFLGFPAVETLLGSGHLPIAVVYDQLGTFLILAVYGSIVAGHYGGQGASVGAAVRKLATFPPFLALLAGLALRPMAPLPDPLEELIGLLAAMVVPLAMLAVGMRIDLGREGWRPGLLAYGLGMRMIVAPALVLVAAVLVGGEGRVWETSQLLAGMPPMVVAALLAADAGCDGQLAARLVGAGALLAMATLPLLALLAG